LAVDPTSFLHEEVRKARRRMERALAKGDWGAAARQARRAAELLRELARYRRVGGDELLRLAGEYEALARRLDSGEPLAAPSTPAAGGGRYGLKPVATGRGASLDAEFEARAEALIARADVTWDDIAGLDEVKRGLIEAIFFSIAKPEEPVRLEPPRRFLLYGPPGTGKTMLAMAASNMLKATFINVSVDRVLSRYVGDSPRMVSAIFRVAYRRAPSVIFFDEVEALTARREGREVAAGVVQTFLTELDGFKSKALGRPVIVIAATNKPWMLDEAILSRFEKRVYVPLPDRRARERIFELEIGGRGFRLEGITYGELADMTEGYSGRDISNACREAIMAMLRRANPNIYEELAKARTLRQLTLAKYRVEPIRRGEILEALRKVKPALSREEIRRYEEWGRRYGGV